MNKLAYNNSLNFIIKITFFAVVIGVITLLSPILPFQAFRTMVNMRAKISSEKEISKIHHHNVILSIFLVIGILSYGYVQWTIPEYRTYSNLGISIDYLNRMEVIEFPSDGPVLNACDYGSVQFESNYGDIWLAWLIEPRLTDIDFFLDAYIDEYYSDFEIIERDERNSSTYRNNELKIQTFSVSKNRRDLNVILGGWFDVEKDEIYFLFVETEEANSYEVFMHCLDSLEY